MTQQTDTTALVAAYVTRKGVRHMPPGIARNRLQWHRMPNPTHMLPLSLGLVGRW